MARWRADPARAGAGRSRPGRAAAPADAPDAAGHQAPSGLTTLGRCLIAAGVSSSLCAVLLNELDLLRIGVLVATMALLSAAVAARTRLVVRAERALDPVRLSAGDAATATLTVHAARRSFGAGLELRDALPDALGGSGSPRFAARPPGAGRPPLVLHYPIHPTVRGIHLVGPLSMRVRDPLGLAEYERELIGREPLTVLPRVTPLTGLPEGFGRGEGDSGTTGLRRGLGEHDALVRPYQPGDPLRMVHWRSTARRDELMVRVEERPWHGGVTVLLDRRTPAHRGRGARASLEWSIELVASICCHLSRAGRRVTLVAENGVVLAAGGDADQLLDVLATLRPSTHPGLVPPSGETGELFAVLGAVDTEQVRPLIDSAAGGHGHAVLLDVAAWAAGGAGGPADRVPAAGTPSVAAPSRALTDAGWTVLVGRPDRRPDQVWNDFCRRRPSPAGRAR